ncbi:MAG: ATP-binding protein, partial [Acidobacteria bacterium]|nr:ATP-binding protein [Acidobacteriota bacterium]
NRLRSAIDADRRRNGRFLLLGSVSPALMTQVSESLAGRLSVIELAPLLLCELQEDRLQKLWLNGGFPDGGVLGTGGFPRWQRDYLNLMVQRDLPNWGLPAQPQVTLRLVRMLAAVHGQIWNASSIGQSLGLSYHTVNKYLDYLEGAFMVRRLQPFHANLRKRLVRSSRIYWRDSGVLHSILGIEDCEGLLHHPAVGASWEGFVIGQVLDWLAASGYAAQPAFFRTSDGVEIDLVFRHRKALWAVEVKLTSAPSDEDFRNLDRAAELIGAGRRVLVSQTAHSAFGRDRSSCTLPELVGLLDG